MVSVSGTFLALRYAIPNPLNSYVRPPLTLTKYSSAMWLAMWLIRRANVGQPKFPPDTECTVYKYCLSFTASTTVKNVLQHIFLYFAKKSSTSTHTSPWG